MVLHKNRENLWLSRAFPVWRRFAWGGKSPDKTILMFAFGAGLLAIIPIFYIVYRAASSDYEVWTRLWNTRLPALIANTLSLTVVVAFVTVLIAVPLAWLTVRSDLQGKKTYRRLLALPLVIPPYIGAFTYIYMFGFDGIFKNVVLKLLGFAPEIYTFGGTAMVLALFTFPYTYLLVASSLESSNSIFEEAARACGYSHWEVFRSVTLRLLRPAIGAGSLLTALYVLSDFGVVAMLRYETFTSAIYTQLVGRYDRSAAAILSLVLIGITAFVLWLDWQTGKNKKYYQTSVSYKAGLTVKLGKWRWPCLIFVWTILLASVFLPLLLLAGMTLKGVSEGAIGAEFWRYTANSLLTAASAATAASFLSLPVAYLSARYNGVLGKGLAMLSYSGYALPGVIIALGLVFTFNKFLPSFYGTTLLLVTAYVIRFMPQGLQAQESAFALISPNVEDAAASCGYSRWETIWRVILPLIKPGIISGWILMFLSSMKELPATLLLRPAGFDTLSVRIWIEASEGFYHLAAPAAMLLVLVSLVPLHYLFSVSRERRTD